MASFDFRTLIEFIKKANDNSLSKRDLPAFYKHLKVKYGFGLGTPAKVPWMAFLGHDQEVQEGIYPVFLYYKGFDISNKQRLLILAYGVSSARTPNCEWMFKNSVPPRIDQYFLDNYNYKQKKYPESFVYKVYIVDSEKPDYGLNEKDILKGVDKIVEFFDQHFNQTEGQEIKEDVTKIVVESANKHTSIVDSFFKDANHAGLFVTRDFAARLIGSLMAKPFVILTGLSGSGKTKLGQAFAKWICEDKDQYILVPVGADWTNREPLLGYPNALDLGKYVMPDTGVLNFILRSQSNQDKPYFMILDEMNLSHVERYFADFLSAMESDEPIRLHSEKASLDGVPATIKLPKNLFIIGTVNIDETTYMFSPKVLDRANVIEFSISSKEMSDFLVGHSYLKLDQISGKGAKFIRLMIIETIPYQRGEVSINSILIDFFEQLKEIGSEFGYRSAYEIVRLVSILQFLCPDFEHEKIVDIAIIQKLLPKVHGSRNQLTKALKVMVSLCLRNNEIIDDVIAGKISLSDSKTDLLYPLSIDKLLRMYKKMNDNGFTSYAEA